MIEQGVPAALAHAGVVGRRGRRARGRLHLVHGAADRRRRHAAVLLTDRLAGRRTRGRSCGSTTPPSGSPTGSTRSRCERGEPFLERYGGRISSEWYFPKLIEVWDEDREVYDACDVFLEATDWIVWWLTGALVRQSTTAGYKAMWSPDEGSAAGRLLRGLPIRGSTARTEKLGYGVCRRWAPARDRCGRARGLAGTAGDGRGRGRQRRLVRVGARRRRRATADVRDGDRHLDLRHGRRPGRGSAAGDHRRRPRRDPAGPVRLRGRPGGGRRHARVGSCARSAAMPPTFASLEARGRGTVAPGASGLVALDWFNGNRTILADADLTGSILGLTLSDDPSRDLPGAAGVDRVRQPPDHGQLHRARPRARSDRRVRRDRRAQPADDADHRRRQRPAGGRARLPRGSGARRGAVRRRRRRRVRRHRCGGAGDAARDRADVHARPGRGRGLRRACTRSFASSTTCSASSRSELLHELKRIRAERRAA